MKHLIQQKKKKKMIFQNEIIKKKGDLTIYQYPN